MDRAWRLIGDVGWEVWSVKEKEENEHMYVYVIYTFNLYIQTTRIVYICKS